MSCQEVLSLLSAYMDGEADPSDSRFVEEHVAECAECSRELSLLRDTARMLATRPEVEPPVGLLEQIEAATTGNPSIWQRLSAAMGSMPAYGRWAAATTAAAAILLGILVSRPPHYTVSRPGYQPQPRSVAVSPPAAAITLPKISVTPKQPTISIARQPVRVHPRQMRGRHVAAARVHTKSLVAGNATGEPAREIVAAEEKTATPVEEAPATPSPGKEAVASVAPAEPKPVQEAKIAKVAVSPADHLKQENDSLAKLRAELAAKNKHRNLQIKVDPIEGRKVSVALASIRF